MYVSIDFPHTVILLSFYTLDIKLYRYVIYFFKSCSDRVGYYPISEMAET